jgi:hypothetical protein
MRTSWQAFEIGTVQAKTAAFSQEIRLFFTANLVYFLKVS